MSYPPLPSNGETQWGNKFIAWADALEGRKVEGEGLSLRRDTTVGTRVFLDYPGGSTMLYGDTGWRLVSTYLHDHIVPGGTGAQLRIEGTTAHLIIRDAKIGPDRVGQPLSNTVAIFNFPPGAAPARAYSVALGTIKYSQYSGVLQPSAFVNRLDGFFPPGTVNWPENASVTISASWQVAGWPTTLFGTPS